MTLVDLLLALLLVVPAPVEPAPVVVAPAPVVQELEQVPVLPDHPVMVPEPAPAVSPRTPAPTVPCDESTGEWVLVFDAHGVERCRPMAEVDKGD